MGCLDVIYSTAFFIRIHGLLSNEEEISEKQLSAKTTDPKGAAILELKMDSFRWGEASGDLTSRLFITELSKNLLRDLVFSKQPFGLLKIRLLVFKVGLGAAVMLVFYNAGNVLGEKSSEERCFG